MLAGVFPAAVGEPTTTTTFCAGFFFCLAETVSEIRYFQTRKTRKCLMVEISLCSASLSLCQAGNYTHWKDGVTAKESRELS